MTEEQGERVVEIRRFSLVHLVPQGIFDDAEDDVVNCIKRQLCDELLASVDRQGFEPYGSVLLTLDRDEDWFLRPYRQTWWEWLLRRPLRYPDPIHKLRAECRALPKGTL